MGDAPAPLPQLTRDQTLYALGAVGVSGCMRELRLLVLERDLTHLGHVAPFFPPSPFICFLSYPLVVDGVVISKLGTRNSGLSLQAPGACH